MLEQLKDNEEVAPHYETLKQGLMDDETSWTEGLSNRYGDEGPYQWDGTEGEEYEKHCIRGRRIKNKKNNKEKKKQEEDEGGRKTRFNTIKRGTKKENKTNEQQNHQPANRNR